MQKLRRVDRFHLHYMKQTSSKQSKEGARNKSAFCYERARWLRPFLISAAQQALSLSVTVRVVLEIERGHHVSRFVHGDLVLVQAELPYLLLLAIVERALVSHLTRVNPLNLLHFYN